MSQKRPLAPSFINRLDRYLLLNKPEIWSSRAHLVLYYGLLFFVVLTVIAFIVPDDPRTKTPASYWLGFVSLISAVGIIGWIIYLVRFNVFKRYGLTGPVSRLITFVLYFISIGIFVLFCYVEPYVESVRANAAYTEAEIVNDLNTLNVGIAKLEYDSLDHEWSTDTVLVTDRVRPSDDAPSPEERVYVETDEGEENGIVEINRLDLEEKLARVDSAQKLNDSIYVFLGCPTYTFINVYTLQPEASQKILSSLDIYKQVIRNYVRPKDTAGLRKQLTALQDKYAWQKRRYYSSDEHEEYAYTMNNWYKLQDIRQSMHNILERKQRWQSENIPSAIRVFLYITLVLSMLLFTFRHTTARTFFLTLLTAIILSVLTSLMVAFTGDSEAQVLSMIILYFMVSLGVALTAFRNKRRRAITGIAINLVLWLLPFIPLCAVALYYAGMDLSDRADYERYYFERPYYLLLAEVFGFLLLLAMIGPFFHRIYRKWYPAPEH
jgi:uncharacterized membrane protein